MQIRSGPTLIIMEEEKRSYWTPHHLPCPTDSNIWKDTKVLLSFYLGLLYILHIRWPSSSFMSHDVHPHLYLLGFCLVFFLFISFILCFLTTQLYPSTIAVISCHIRLLSFSKPTNKQNISKAKTCKPQIGNVVFQCNSFCLRWWHITIWNLPFKSISIKMTPLR